MMSCSDFEPGTSHTPTTCPEDSSHIAAIPWVYEGLQRDVIESCFLIGVVFFQLLAVGSVRVNIRYRYRAIIIDLILKYY